MGNNLQYIGIPTWQAANLCRFLFTWNPRIFKKLVHQKEFAWIHKDMAYFFDNHVDNIIIRSKNSLPATVLNSAEVSIPLNRLYHESVIYPDKKLNL